MRKAIFLLSFFVVRRQSVLCVAARNTSHLTLATLTSVAFLRSIKMRKLPAPKEHHHQRMVKCTASEVQKLWAKPSRILNTKHVSAAVEFHWAY